MTHRDADRLLYRLLDLDRVFQYSVDQLRAFAMIAAFLGISSEEARRNEAVLLYRNRRNGLAIGIGRLFCGRFLGVPATSTTSMFPEVLWIFLALNGELSLA